MWARVTTGASAANSTKGSKARAIGQAATASTISTVEGTSTATNAGATVWAKKYSMVSTSWLARAIRSPERRRIR